MEKMFPTKANLIKSKSMLTFSKQGYQLLDKKRNVLVREIMSMIEQVQLLQKRIDEVFSEVYSALQHANITMGTSSVAETAISIPVEENIRILNKSVMNVEIPTIKYVQSPQKPPYGFYRTNSALDITVTKMKEVQKLVYRLAEVENGVFRLAEEIRKTNKRANALDKIQIPKYEELTKWIEESLEEKEREDFFRLKRVKVKKL